MKKKNILVRYTINTIYAGVFFAPIVIYNQYSGGHKLNEDDVIAFFMLGWLFGSFLSGIFSAFVITSKDAIKTINEVKNGIKGE